MPPALSVREWLRLSRAERRNRREAFRRAVLALRVNSASEHELGIDWETPEYHGFNRTVNELWGTVPWFVHEFVFTLG